MSDERVRVTDTMSGSDALLWTVGRDPVLRPTVVAVMALDRAPCWADVKARMATLVEVVPRLRSRAMTRPLGRGRPQFVTDDHFDLDFHLRRIGLPAEATFRQVLDLAQVMAARGFDAELPPWEAVLIEGVDGERAALVIKLHHALVDGVGGIAVLMHLLDRVRHPSPEPASAPEATPQRASVGFLQRLPTAGQIVGSVSLVATHPLGQLQQVLTTVASAARFLAPVGRPISPLMTDRGFKRGFEVIDLAPGALRHAATATGGTLNDVFVAAVVRGLTLYHQRHGMSIDRLRALMPVSVRADDDQEGGNHFVPARFIVPAPADAGECVREVQRITASWKHAAGLGVSDALAVGLDMLPDPLVIAMWGSMLKGGDFCVTNVPGPPFETYLAGARVERMYAFAPPSGSAVNVSLVTSADRACVGIVVDRAAIPDSPQLAACLADGFDEIVHLSDRQAS
jgi:diacylglycerol O-acyltransferase / wax synthase